MKLTNFFLIFLIGLVDTVICSLDALQHDRRVQNYNDLDSLQEFSRSWYHKTQPESDHFNMFGPRRRTRRATCKSFPRICRLKGSPGRSCCKKKCVNLRSDRRNCGACGKKCRFSQICCGGKCVDPSFSKRHCGGCDNRCGSGGLCAFGLCSYA